MSLLAAISQSESVRIAEFPVTAHKTFLAHAAVCPLPARVAKALTDHALHSSHEGQFEHLHGPAELGARQLAAAMLGVTSDEIAFIPSTSAGLSMIAQGLRWSPGDAVVIAASDFPANLHPWLALRAKGVDVRILPRQLDGSIGIEDLEPLLDDHVRLVSLSSAHFGIGTPIDIALIGSFLRQRNILFCLDAIQTLGAQPVDATQVDFLAADAHKWLLGPQGIGILVVRKHRFEALTPILTGWKSVAASKDYSSLNPDLAPSARRYEPGSLNASGLCGLHAALQILSESGIHNIADRIGTLRARAELGLRQQSHRVMGRPYESGTGIVAFQPRTGSVVELAKRLDKEGFVLSTRGDISGTPCIRIAPHFYNTPEEIDRLLSRL